MMSFQIVHVIAYVVLYKTDSLNLFLSYVREERILLVGEMMLLADAAAVDAVLHLLLSYSLSC